MDIYEQLKRDEGFRQFPYPDTAGIMTVGYGRNLKARGISAAEAEIMLQHDVAAVTSKLHSALPWTINLDGARFGVLVNMGFNLGTAGLLDWQNTLSLVSTGRYADAAKLMRNSEWAKQVGARAERLALQMETGVWQ